MFMEESLVRRVQSTTSRSYSQSGPTSKEYDELIHLLVKRNKVIEDLKYECNHNGNSIPINKVKKILQENGV